MTEQNPSYSVKNTKKTLSIKSMAFCAMFCVLIIVGAFIKIPIPVVPFTLQFLFTNLAGIFLGRKLGSAAVILYILLGLVGLPIFVSGGGIGYIFQPTFGYLIGFAFGAWAAGLACEKLSFLKSKKYVIAGLLNLAIVYAFGMFYYYMISKYYLGSPIGAKALVLYCFLLAVPGDIFLCFLSASLAKKLSFLLLKTAL